MYASNAGKSGGEFFTPQEISRLIAELTHLPDSSSVYDFACGSGSLLLQCAKKANIHKYFGQEVNPTSHRLCRMNMILHGINYTEFDIAFGDTLTNSYHIDSRFDVVVSNPPYSTKWIGDNDATLHNDPRFSDAGSLAPKSNADFAFLLHGLHCLSSSGIMAIVMFPGTLYRQNAEAKIRQYLIDNNYIDTIIHLPDKLFSNKGKGKKVGISVCVYVLKKNKTAHDVLFINAQKEFVKSTNANKLSDENISHILELYRNRKNVKYKSCLASHETIVENNYILSVSNYVEQEDSREIIDIGALNTELKDIVKKQENLREKIDAIVDDLEMAVNE